MNSKKKIVSLILAIAVVFGAMGLPVLAGSVASADSLVETTSTSEFSINKINQNIVYNVNESITLENDKSVQIWAPNGEVLHKFSDDKIASFQFTKAGLYAFMYKSEEGVYSDQFFVSVQSAQSSIILTQEISATAKTGSYVTIPSYIGEGVSVHVYSSYGKEVQINDGKFTNLANCKGTYYIEYNKGTEYKYVTVVFGDNYSENTIKDIADLNSEYVLDFSDDLDKIIEDDAVYLFKKYTVSAVVFDRSGRELSSAESGINVQIGEEEGIDTIFETSFEGFSDLSKASSKTIKIAITTNEEIGLNKTIEVPVKFNEECVELKSESLIKDYLTLDELKVGYVISSAKMVIANGYSVGENTAFNGYSLLTLSYTNDASKNVGYVDGEEHDLITLTEFKDGDNLIGANIKAYNDEVKFDDIDANHRTIKIVYKFELSLPDDNGNRIWTKEYSINLVNDTSSFADDQKPVISTITVGDTIIESGVDNFVVPSVKLTDVNNAGVNTNGASLVVSYTKVGESATEAHTGDILTLNAGTYVFNYVAIDSVGNKSTKTFTIKVKDGTETDIASNLTLTNVVCNDTDDGYKFTFTTNAVSAIVYVDGENPTSPKSVTYSTGVITGLTVDTDKDFIVVLKAEKGSEVKYVAIKVQGKSNVTEVVPYSYNNRDEIHSYEARFNASIDVQVGDRVVWSKGSDFTIESDSLYYVENANEIVLKTAGTLTITDTSSGQKAVIKVSEGTVKSPIYANSSKQVTSVVDGDGQAVISEIVIELPYMENYFGYNLTTVITSLNGSPINYSNGVLSVSKVDNYTFRHTFTYAGTTKTLTETISSGDVVKPTINISSAYKTIEWNGNKLRVEILPANAIDKFGNTINIGSANIVVKDNNGKVLELKNDGEKLYVEVESAGIYTVSYTATDSDGIVATDTANILVLYPEEPEKGLSTWAIVGIVLGSLAIVGACAFAIYAYIKSNKKKNKFINKEKKTKKEESNNLTLYTISESKDGTIWTVKKDNGVISKCKSKEEAIEKVNSLKSASYKVKIYSKNGRLIDSIENKEV